MEAWSVERLERGAVGVSASRRTDIPALFAPWFARRLEEGFVEYLPAGPPRRVRRSLLPRHVTHFTFWTKWPRPFRRVLETVLSRGWPVLWNVTVTGLGGTDVEPGVPTSDRVVAAVRDLAARVGPGAVLWRYDPIFLSRRFDAAHHLATFTRLADALAGHVDRVACSFVTRYGRRVSTDLLAWEAESGDRFREADLEEQADLAGRLQALARARGIPFTICCSEPLQVLLGCPPAAATALNGRAGSTRPSVPIVH